MNTEDLQIGELAKKAGVSVRTIRYYVSEGLLPPPATRGRYSVYDLTYLNRIILIKRMKDVFLPIKEIRKRLETQSKEEIEAYLARLEVNPAPPQSALAYVSKLLESDSGVEAAAPPPTLNSMAPPSHRAMVKESRQLFDEPPARQESSWTRVVLMDGVELHISEQAIAQLSPEAIENLTTAIRHVLQDKSSHIEKI